MYFSKLNKAFYAWSNKYSKPIQVDTFSTFNQTSVKSILLRTDICWKKKKNVFWNADGSNVIPKPTECKDIKVNCVANCMSTAAIVNCKNTILTNQRYHLCILLVTPYHSSILSKTNKKCGHGIFKMVSNQVGSMVA